MLNEPVLVDTGALLAIYSAKDVHHSQCRVQAEALPIGKVFTCWPVITETAYLLRKYPAARDHFLSRVQTHEFILLPLGTQDVQGIRDVFAKYQDQQVDLADAALVHLAGREDIRAVFTTDRRHFETYSLPDGRNFRILPEHSR